MKNNQCKVLFTGVMLLSLYILYVHQASPAPLLGVLAERFSIVNNDALLNLSISITYPMTIIFSLLGASLEPRLGARRLFSAAMLFGIASLVINYFMVSYNVFLVGRVLYGISFGLAMPFFGVAIMKWYDERQREKLNTINGLYPFLGAITSYACMFPLYQLLGKSANSAFGVWGLALLVMLALWLLIKEPEVMAGAEPAEPTESEQSLYLNLLKRKSIRLLCVTFFCDFVCYSFISTVLPTYLFELSNGSLSEAAVGILSALAFPGTGILGASLGGLFITKIGLRKPPLITGQVLKLLGFLLASRGATQSVGVVLAGVALFGLGNSIWIPAMYTVPMDLEDMTPSRVGASFSLITSTGFIAGTVSPVIGGWMTNRFMELSGLADPVLSHVYGIKSCLFILAFFNVISIICMCMIKESGTRRHSVVPATTQA